MSERRIFCFWEPRDCVPAYLRLCMRTWEGHIPDYKIVLLDYSNLRDWIEEGDLDVETLKAMSLAQQADAIRAAVLFRHGGIWMDLDTIITSPNCRVLLPEAGKFTLINKHVAFISVDGAGHPIAEGWLRNVQRRLAVVRWYCGRTSRFSRFVRLARSHFLHTRPVLLDRWDAMGNGPLEPALKRYATQFRSLDRTELKALPEVFISTNGTTNMRAYEEFYFTNKHVELLLSAAREGSGIVCLHNSWTPKRFRQMDEKTFLASGVALAELLKQVLPEEVRSHGAL